MTAQLVFAAAVALSFVLLAAAFAVVALRIANGPTLADRVLSLYMLSIVAGGFCAVVGARSGLSAFADAVLVLVFMALLSLVAAARRLVATATNRATQDLGDE